MAGTLTVECENCGIVQSLDPDAFPMCENCDSSNLTQRKAV